MSLTKNPEIVVTDLAQTQKVMDLANGNEDASIEIKQKKFAAPAYDAEIYGGTEDEFNEALLTAASEIVSPAASRITALLSFATSQSYQAAKTEALSKGEYLTSDLRARIVQVMRGNKDFVDVSASDCFKRWKAGFAAKKTGAVKILDMAKTMGEFGDDL